MKVFSPLCQRVLSRLRPMNKAALYWKPHACGWVTVTALKRITTRHSNAGCLCNAGKRPSASPPLSKNLALMTFNQRSATPMDGGAERPPASLLMNDPMKRFIAEIIRPHESERVLIIPQFVSVLGDHLGRAWHQRHRQLRGHHRPAAREDRGLLQPGLWRKVCSSRSSGGSGARHHGLCEGRPIWTDLQA